MSRIAIPATVADAPAAAAPLLAAVHAQLGVVPNMYRLIAKNPAVLEGYLALSSALGKGALTPSTRTRIAVAVAQVNGCTYCLSAHTFIGKNLQKLSDAELTANRDGASTDAKADAAVRFASEVARARGQVDAASVNAVRGAGYSDAEVIEIIMHVAINTWTNALNNAIDTDLDFPLVAARR